MKKTVFLIIAVMLLTLAFAGVAAANNAPDEGYVGKGMELAEGEMGIVSIEIDEDEDYVGKDMELAEGEMGIVSIEIDEDEDYVGKDMNLVEGEMGIVSIDAGDEVEKSNLPLYGGIGFLTIGLFFITYKKVLA
ncbi:MAG: hypothetical protein KGZ79_05105 [Dethiobacter sp.]|nr:hypothetical protein [Dethiobacter sp.]